ncbi:MAG TPA: lysophospholipid acyltransferase family protein [Bryobacteraceae bacterium]
MASKKNALTISIEYALAKTILGILRFTPANLAFPIARVGAATLRVAVPKLAKTARRNLEFAYPKLTQDDRTRLIHDIFYGLARSLVVFSKFPALNASNIRQWIRYEGLEHYTAAKAKGRGILIATAHLGNWELSAFAHALMTEPMHVMVRPLDNPLIDQLVEHRRQLSGNRLLLKKDAALSIVRALKQNEAVGILIDQNAAPEEGVFVDFFGKKACASSAFAKLAARTGAAVVAGFALWEESEKKYVLRFFPELKMTGDTQADTQAIHAEFERVIRKYPDQWMWIHRRWKNRPPGEAPLY